MKLLTHNLMKCNRKACSALAPSLGLTVEEWVSNERPFNEKLIKRIFDRVNWELLLKTLGDLGWEHDFPAEMTEEQFLANEGGVLEKAHDLLLNRSVVTGTLTCLNCERQYAIKGKVPNLLLEDDEV